MFFGLLFSLFGLMFVFVARLALSILEKDKPVKSCDAHTVGRVVRILEERSNNVNFRRHMMFRPEYVFYDAYRNKERHCVSRVLRYPCNVRVGDKADILYSSENERDYIVMDDTKFDIWMRRFFDGIGFFFVVIGIVTTICGFL